MTIWQDLSQIQAVYKDEWQTILTNSVSRLFLGGQGDPETAKYLSDASGHALIAVQTTSFDEDGDERGESEGRTEKQLITPAGLRLMDDYKGYLMSGNHPIVLLEMRPHFNDSISCRRENDPIGAAFDDRNKYPQQQSSRNSHAVAVMAMTTAATALAATMEPAGAFVNPYAEVPVLTGETFEENRQAALLKVEESPTATNDDCWFSA